MKFTFSLLVCALVLILSCKKDNTPDPPKNNINLKSGLLVYLPFDGNMADSSGNGNITTSIAGAALSYDEHGYPQRAFNGTGNGERILVTNNGSIKFDTAYTVSFDFMIRDFRHHTLLSFVDHNTGKAPTFMIKIDPVNYKLIYGPNDSTETCDGYGNVKNVDTVQFIPQPESWYNAIFIYHKGQVQVYINGKLAFTNSGSGLNALLCPSAQLVVGGWWQGGPLSLNGRLDEIRLYNRVLNSDEIAELAKNFQNN